MFEIIPTILPGCLELKSKKNIDNRGYFVKTCHRDFFQSAGLRSDFAEQYYSVSIKNCLRGLHFQVPPYEHDKLVYSVNGRVLDVVLDIRLGSPTYGVAIAALLDSDRCNQIYIPAGMAHGFLTLSESATLVYNVTSIYSPEHDTGIHWTSANIDWGVISPIISSRDQVLETLDTFISPFVFA